MPPPLKNAEDERAHIQALLAEATRRGDALEIELGQVRQDLAQADIRLDRLCVRLVATRGEAARLRMAAREFARDEEAMSTSMSRLRGIIEARDATIAAIAQSLRLNEQELDGLRRQMDSAPQSRSAVSDQRSLPSVASVETEAGQLAALQRRLRAAEDDASLQLSLVSLLQGIVGVLAARGRWWLALLPGYWVRRMKYDRLRKKGLFDAQLYQKRYPDVGRAKVDPLQHYVSHGIEEGRLRI